MSPDGTPVLNAGRTLGPYEIVAPPGAGGMGEVYRARDTRLKRDVAIKVLPAEFAADPERLARFRREAELLAALNHANIAAVYGLEEADGSVAIAMELVEGESLEQKLTGLRAQGSGLAAAEALAIARQIADALEAAHDKGIVHRDLKPGNIMLRGGQTPGEDYGSLTPFVKVLDFGLAKIEAGSGGSSGSGRPGGATHSPTLTFAGTEVGLILGTAVYMSPEQARGKPVDRRTDIWAFGCVLYEMLTGRQAFDMGETVSDAIAAILKPDVNWTALPADVPDQIRLLLKRCLEKERAARIGEIGTARFLMTETISAQRPHAATLPPRPSSRGRSGLVGGAGLIAGAAVAAGVAWWVIHSTPPPLIRPQGCSACPPAAAIRRC